MIAVSGGPKKDYLQKPVSRQLETLIGERQIVTAGKDDRNFIPIISEEPEGVTAQVIAPIICEGDAIGAVALLSRESRIKFGEPEFKLVSTAAGRESVGADAQASFHLRLAAAVQPYAGRMPFFLCGKDLVLPFPGEDMLQSIKKDKKTSEGRVLCGKGRRLWKNI